MSRRLVVCAVVALLGCRAPSDRDDLKVFDEKKAPVAYSELYVRARSQANLALEAFYADAWAELDDAAKGLEQTARFLPKAADTPADVTMSEKLRLDAEKLGDAARAKDVEAANQALQRIQFNVRTLRPGKKDE